MNRSISLIVVGVLAVAAANAQGDDVASQRHGGPGIEAAAW